MKERMIGAAVLVAFAVLIVPVFLDGPADESDTVSQSVTLPGQNDQPRRQQTIVLPRDRDEPVPAPTPEPVAGQQDDAASAVAEETAGAAAEAPDSSAAREDPAADADAEPVAEQAAPADAPATDPPAAAAQQATATPAAAGDGGLFAVQLGSFSSRGNAERLAADLRAAGFAAFLSRVATNGGELHRVRVGPQKDRAAATEVAGRLAEAGHRGQVVSHP